MRLIAYTVFPPEEHDHLEIVNNARFSMDMVILRMIAAYELFGYARRRAEELRVQTPPGMRPPEFRTVLLWQHIAGKDGAGSIYDFGRHIAAIRENLKESPTVQGLMDIPAFEEAKKAFHRALPHAKAIRDAASHRADLFRTPEDFRANAASGPIAVLNGVVGVDITETINGEIVSYSMTLATIDTLIEALKTIDRLFLPVLRQVLRAQGAPSESHVSDEFLLGEYESEKRRQELDL